MPQCMSVQHICVELLGLCDRKCIEIYSKQKGLNVLNNVNYSNTIITT